ncbi:MAG: hypothetical protein JXQ79_09955 [Rhodobacteraceae bacterium]|nr:hypothetical protein [Paracoccaceae bacterium]
MASALRTAPAVSATLTQTAVQQAKAGNRADLLTTRDIVPVADKRNRLVGPPPAFEVNVLQHLRETHGDPRDQPDASAMPDLGAYKDVGRMNAEKDQPPALNTHA